MTVIVLVNMGSRDVLLDDESLYPARSEGKKVWNQYPEMKARLAFPILEPPLTQILDSVPRIDRLILFGTDQDDENYRHSDTLYFAKIAAKAIAERYDGVKEATAVLIRDINPSLHDEALEYYRQKLPQLDLPLTDDTTVYILPAAGTPACSMALLLQGLTLFGNRCRVLYQPQFTKQDQPTVLPIGERLLATFQRQTAVHMLQQYNFHAAAQACEQAGIHNPLVENLLQYATARLWFAFDEAEQALKRAISQARGQIRRHLSGIQTDLAALKAQEPKALLGELYHNARITWENGRLLDFLTRWFRFQQTALALAAARMPADTFKLVTPEDLANDAVRQIIIDRMVEIVHPQAAYTLPADQRTILANNMEAAYNLAELADLCFDLGINFENIAGDTLNSKVVNLIQYCERHNLLFSLRQKNQLKRPGADWGDLEAGHPENTQLVLALRRLEALRPLYKQSVLSAGAAGVTEEAIQEVYGASAALEGTTTPLQDMAAVCGVLAISTENPFRQIKDTIIKQVRT